MNISGQSYGMRKRIYALKEKTNLDVRKSLNNFEVIITSAFEDQTDKLALLLLDESTTNQTLTSTV